MTGIVTLVPPQDRAVTVEGARQQLRLDAHDEDMLLRLMRAPRRGGRVGTQPHTGLAGAAQPA